MVDKTELRESLKAAIKRNPDAINVISAVSCVAESEIKKFVDGDHEALSMVELMTIKCLR